MFCLLAPLYAAADAADGWQTLAVLPWGEGPGEVGLSELREDELQRGPHGIAVAADGRVVIVDRVQGRALVLDEDGELIREIVVPGHPGEATLLPDGRLAVADEIDERLVRVLGAGGGRYRTPRWAMPPTQLVAVQAESGAWIVEGVDGFQNRLPLGEIDPDPGVLERGIPAPDDEGAAVVYRRDDVLHVEFGGEIVVSSADWWPGGSDMTPGSAAVLATDGNTAVIAVESVYPGAGPIRTSRAVFVVGADGGAGEPLLLPDPGPVAIPDDLAALSDGRVVLLVSEAHGCRLLVGRVEGVQR